VLATLSTLAVASLASADFFYRLDEEIDDRGLANVVGSDNCLPEVDSASQKAVLPVTQDLIDEFQGYWDGGGLVELRYSIHASGSTGGMGQARHTVEVFFGVEKVDGTRNLWDAQFDSGIAPEDYFGATDYVILITPDLIGEMEDGDTLVVWLRGTAYARSNDCTVFDQAIGEVRFENSSWPLIYLDTAP